MKVALVHDHLAQDGGAERVLQALQELYPQAPTYVLVYEPERANAAFRGRDIRTSFLQDLPFGRRRYQWFLPLMPTAIERYDLHEYELVISSTSSLAKGILTRPETLHLCYCHTPTRYLWSDTHQYLEEFPTNRLIKAFLPFYLTKLRQWDRLAADRVDDFVANSGPVRDRIWKYYRRPSTIIHPPVDTDRFHRATTVGDYYLSGGRLVPYKRFDLIIRAFNRLGLKLKIFGSGPEYRYLRSFAGPNIEFVGRVPDADRAELYARALAFIHPQEEDFGITAVESMAAGRPVIAYGVGGARETVLDGVTGVFFHEQTWEALGDAVIRFRPEQFDAARIRAQAQTFDTRVFTDQLRAHVDQAWARFQTHRL